MKVKSRIASTALLLAALSVPAASQAMVIETSPADPVALDPGTDLAVFYYQHVNREAYYLSGNRTPGSFGLSTDVTLSRWVHWTTLFGFTVTPQIIVPIGSLRLHSDGSSLNSHGFGDPLVGSEIWLINDKAAQRYLAIGVYVSTPLGNYNPSQGGANLGNNRWEQIRANVKSGV